MVRLASARDEAVCKANKCLLGAVAGVGLMVMRLNSKRTQKGWSTQTAKDNSSPAVNVKQLPGYALRSRICMAAGNQRKVVEIEDCYTQSTWCNSPQWCDHSPT